MGSDGRRCVKVIVWAFGQKECKGDFENENGHRAYVVSGRKVVHRTAERSHF